MKYFAFIALVFVFSDIVNVNGQCSDTGCEPATWAMVGCEYLGKDTKSKRPCPGGHISTCCDRGSGNNNNNANSAESGICSWYGAEGEIPPGWPTASGEGFDRMAMTAAHKTLAFGTRIRVKNSANGKTVDVKINDRGPFHADRIVDLTFGAFGVFENRDKGTTPCSYSIIS